MLGPAADHCAIFSSHPCPIYRRTSGKVRTTSGNQPDSQGSYARLGNGQRQSWFRMERMKSLERAGAYGGSLFDGSGFGRLDKQN